MVKRASQFCATEGHLEDVWHRETRLQRRLFKRKAEKESQCRSGDKEGGYSVTEEIRLVCFTSKRKKHTFTLLIKSKDHKKRQTAGKNEKKSSMRGRFNFRYTQL